MSHIWVISEQADVAAQLLTPAKEFAGQSVYAAPLQSTLQFQRQDRGGGLVNHKMLFIHYKPTGGVELIERM